METLKVSTERETEFKEITGAIQAMVSRGGVKRGQVLVYCPHTTAGLTINENADPSVIADIQADLERLFPRRQGYYRHGEGNSAAHAKASLLGSSLTIPLEHGRLVLGQWQGIFFCEFDGPRSRQVHVRVMGD